MNAKIPALPATLLALLAGPALGGGPLHTAQEPQLVAAAPAPAARPSLTFTLGGGAAVKPDYFGSGDHSLYPDGTIRFHHLRLPGGREFGSADPAHERQGLGLRGSFRYISGRDPADHPELAGLDRVSTSVELGLGVGYTLPGFEAFADVRYGVIGHESFVAEAGADLVLRPTDRTTLRLGPRALWGSSDYAGTYFGVTGPEAAASGLAPFSAGSGLVSAGLELGIEHDLGNRWGLEGAVRWDRLLNDAADSPITRQGDRDQFSLSVGVTRRFTLGF